MSDSQYAKLAIGAALPSFQVAAHILLLVVSIGKIPGPWHYFFFFLKVIQRVKTFIRFEGRTCGIKRNILADPSAYFIRHIFKNTYCYSENKPNNRFIKYYSTVVVWMRNFSHSLTPLNTWFSVGWWCCLGGHTGYGLAGGITSLQMDVENS